MADKSKVEAVKKLMTLLTGVDHCNCTTGGTSKRAALGNLGAVGSNTKKLKPTSVNYRDVSPKPMPQQQLGQAQSDNILNNFTLQRHVQ